MPREVLEIVIDDSGVVSGARRIDRSLKTINASAGKTQTSFQTLRTSMKSLEGAVFNIRNAFLGLGAAFALRQYQVISLGARGALLLGESLLACAVIVTLVAALAAHLGLRREGAAGVAC